MTTTTARVLLVDDEQSQFSYTNNLLQYLGPRYALEWTPTYETGLHRIMRGDVDAALVDYRLGSRSGLDLAREAIGRQCDVPLVILTGQGDESVDLQAMMIGAADYLDKAELTPRTARPHAALRDAPPGIAAAAATARGTLPRADREQRRRHRPPGPRRAHRIRQRLGAAGRGLSAGGTGRPRRVRGRAHRRSGRRRRSAGALPPRAGRHRIERAPRPS